MEPVPDENSLYYRMCSIEVRTFELIIQVEANGAKTRSERVRPFGMGFGSVRLDLGNEANKSNVLHHNIFIFR